MPIRKNIKAAPKAVQAPNDLDNHKQIEAANAAAAEAAKAEKNIPKAAAAEIKRRRKSSKNEMYAVMQATGDVEMHEGGEALQIALDKVLIGAFRELRLFKCKEIKLSLALKKGE